MCPVPDSQPPGIREEKKNTPHMPSYEQIRLSHDMLTTMMVQMVPSLAAAPNLLPRARSFIHVPRDPFREGARLLLGYHSDTSAEKERWKCGVKGCDVV